MSKLNKLILPIAIILASLILGGFFYATQISKQKSIERQQEAKLQLDKQTEEAKAEQANKEYVAERAKDCYAIYEKERKQFNNVSYHFYDELTDRCRVIYETNDYEGVDCEQEYGNIPSMKLECELGIFGKDFF